jgi:hypothetical protein
VGLLDCCCVMWFWLSTVSDNSNAVRVAGMMIKRKTSRVLTPQPCSAPFYVIYHCGLVCFLSFSYVLPLLPTRYRCKGLLLHLITLSDTHTHTHTHIQTYIHTHSLGRTPLDEWSIRHRDLYLTRQNTHEWQTSMPSAGFELAIPANQRPQTHVLEHAATGIGNIQYSDVHFPALVCFGRSLYFSHNSLII